MNNITSINFLTGGNALFTVSNNLAEHYTFKVRRLGDDKPFFISLVGGKGSGHRFSYLGIFQPESNKTVVTRSSKFAVEDLPVKVFKFVVRCLAGRQTLPEGYAIQHEGRCCCCGKKLTDPESIRLGIGPECRRHHAL